MTDGICHDRKREAGVEASMQPMTKSDFCRCKAILLDFGGTLDSDGEHWLDRFYELYEKVGIAVPQERIKQVFYQADALCCDDPRVNGMGLRPLMRHHVRLQFAALDLNDRLREERMVEEFCSKTEACLQRNQRLLARLHGRYQMAVVSNFYGNVAALCDEAGLSPYLTTILDSTQVGLAKPDPDIFRAALQKLDAEAGECVFVGDSYERDMLPARRLGMKTIWVKGPNPRLPVAPEPVDHTISSLAELEALLL